MSVVRAHRRDTLCACHPVGVTQLCPHAHVRGWACWRARVRHTMQTSVSSLVLCAARSCFMAVPGVDWHLFATATANDAATSREARRSDGRPGVPAARVNILFVALPVVLCAGAKGAGGIPTTRNQEIDLSLNLLAKPTSRFGGSTFSVQNGSFFHSQLSSPG